MLNLVKGAEKRPRESILQAELASAIAYINKSAVRARPPCRNHFTGCRPRISGVLSTNAASRRAVLRLGGSGPACFI